MVVRPHILWRLDKANKHIPTKIAKLLTDEDCSKSIVLGARPALHGLRLMLEASLNSLLLLQSETAH